MKRLLAVALLALLFVSCKKEDDNNNQSASGLDFTSYRKYDVDANYLGNEGNAVDDYHHENWPDWVFDLFKPIDTANLTGYVKSDVSIDALYPNPCRDTQVMRLWAKQPVNLKVVIVDINKNVYLRETYHIPSAIHFLGFDYKMRNMTPNTFYRMFYTFSAENNKNFYRGHIDIYKTQ